MNIRIMMATVLFPLLASATVYEGDEHWTIYDNKPAGATIESVYDESKKSEVVVFNGDAKRNAYIMGSRKGAKAWKNQNEKKIKWDMNFKEKFKISIFIETEQGNRTLLYYSHPEDRGLVKEKYIRFGLGNRTIQGNWVTIERNLEKDLKKFNPDNHLIAVNGFKVQGSGKIGKLELFKGEENPLIENEMTFSNSLFKNGAIKVRVHSGSGFIRSKDWIAVYKKGSSTEWKNVIHWSWVRHLPIDKPGYHVYSTQQLSLPKGEYEVRYFHDNSYTIAKSFDFTVKEVTSYLSKLYVDYDDGEEYKILLSGFTKGETYPGDSDWIGIYKKGSSNSWSNVVEWMWAKDTSYHFIRRNMRVVRLDYKSNKYERDTQYEARYFLNNSFITYKKSDLFRVKGHPNKITVIYSPSGEISVFGFNNKDIKPYEEPHGDWIAVYAVAGGLPIETERVKNLEFNEKTQAYIYHINKSLYKPETAYMVTYDSVGPQKKSVESEEFFVK